MSLGVLSLAMSYAGRAGGIYFAGTLQKKAHFAALFGALIAFILFNVGSTITYFSGAIFFGLSVSAANIFTRSNLLGLPLCYCLSQFSFLDLLKTSEQLKSLNYALPYEVVGFSDGAIFSVSSYSSQGTLQIVLCGLDFVYFMSLVVDRGKTDGCNFTTPVIQGLIYMTP